MILSHEHYTEFWRSMKYDWLLIAGPALGFILSLLYILYVEFTLRFKKVRLV